MFPVMVIAAVNLGSVTNDKMIVVDKSNLRILILNCHQGHGARFVASERRFVRAAPLISFDTLTMIISY